LQVNLQLLFSKKCGHIPIIDVNPRNCEETKIAIEGDKLLAKWENRHI